MKTKILPNRIFMTFSRLQRSCFSALFFLVFLLLASSSWGQVAQTVTLNPGTTTWTSPVGVTEITVQCWGGGGGGGRSTSNNVGGSGGGSGGYTTRTIALNGQTTFTIAVGTGGAGGASSGTSAVAGGNTTFSNSALSLNMVANGGGFGVGNAGSAGAGGTASGGTTNTSGRAGSVGGTSGGAGGNAPNGGLGGVARTNGTGNPGVAPGGGGGGGERDSSNNRGGGSGGAGRIFITYTVPTDIAYPYFRSRNTGGWNSTNTWEMSTDNSDWTDATIVPTLNSIVIINSGHTVTVDVDNAACAAVDFLSNSSSSATLTVGSGRNLTVSGTVTIPRQSSNINTFNVGAGTATVGAIAFTDGGGTVRHRVTISTGTLTVLGDITTDDTDVSASVIFSGAGTLNVGGQLMSSGTVGGTLTTVAGSTVNYNGNGAQTVRINAYSNLRLSGSGVKTFAGLVTASANLSIAEGVSANLGTLTTHTANSLTLGNLNTLNGTWGSTNSTATFKNNTFFAATTGRVTVSTNTAATPTVTVTPIGTYTYNRSAQGPNAATNTGTGTSYTYSYAGVSPTVYSASPTRPTNAGSYTVTATVANSTDGFWRQASSSATAFSITQATLTVTGLTGSNKVYNRTTAATATGTAALSGVISPDAVNLTGTPTFTFASANVGTGISISTTGYSLTGANAANYTLTQPTLSANITQATLTVTGLTGSNKVYNRTTAATATGTAALSGVISPDAVNLTGTPTFTFASANVGTGISISTTGYSLTGANAANYTLTQPTLSANITQATLTVTGLTGVNKIYDGLTTATTTGTAALSGVLEGDVANVTLGGTPVRNFADANIGVAKAITITGYTISGTASGNYTLSQPTGLTGDITAATLTVTANTATHTYGATLTAGAGATPLSVTGMQNSETLAGTVTLDYTSGNTTTSAVGTYTGAVSPSAFVKTSGTATLSNYTINYVTNNLTVTPAALTITADNASKCFGTTYALGTSAFTSSGLQNSETIGGVTLTSEGAASGAGAISYSIVPSAATGGTFNAANYTISYTNGTLTVNALPTVTAPADQSVCAGSSVTLSGSGATSYTWNNGISNGVAFTPSATTTYTVTGTDANGCTNTATTTVTVNPIATPTFTQVAAICSGATLNALPTTSINGITGTWSPALDNTATTTYTFTPSAGQCATTATMTITVNPNVTPTFTQVAAICSGATLFPLPTTSNNLINGTWSPAVNNTATTTYTFTPTAGQCASTATMTITVNSVTNPSVAIASSAAGAICPGTSVTFTATPSNGGANPTYQWRLNGTNIAGANSPTFTTTALNNGQIITVAMTVTEACATTATSLSNGITAAVNTPVGITAITPASSAIATTQTTTITASGVVGTGVQVRWYSGPNQTGTAYGTGLTSNPVPPGTYYAYVTGTCGSAIELSTTIAGLFSWTGATNNRWDMASNWAEGVVPTAETAVVISDTAVRQPEISGNNTISYANSITLLGNAVLTIKQNSGLEVTNGISVANTAQFIVEDKANLKQVNPNAVNSGKIKVRRATRGLQRLDYVLFSSPTNGTQTLKQFSPQTVDNRFYTYNSATNVYSEVGNVQTPFETGKGYLIRTPNNHNSSPAQWNVEFEGAPNNGTIIQQLPAPASGDQNRYFAVGNPYASAINVMSFIEANQANIEGIIFIWRKTNGTAISGYASLKRNINNQLEFLGNGSGGANDPGNCIPSGQGFIVEMKQGASQVVFTNDMRICNGFGEFNRLTQATNSTTSSDQYTLKLARDNGEFTFANVGYFTNGLHSYEPSYDVQSMSDAALSIASVVENKRIVSQSRASFEVSDVVPLSLIANVAGSYQLSLDSVGGLFITNQIVYLRDNLMNTTHNLSQGAYSFASQAGTFDTRFEIIYQSNTLGVTTPGFNENQVVIFKTPTSELSINTGNVIMSSVRIFDITGKLLLEKKGIEASQTLLKLNSTTEVLLVQITSSEGKVVTKKVLFPRTSLKLDKKIEVKTQLAEDE